MTQNATERLSRKDFKLKIANSQFSICNLFAFRRGTRAAELDIFGIVFHEKNPLVYVHVYSPDRICGREK
jgi:hypothetical protein